MIQQSKVIILRVIDYQESSKILTVLSKTHGKIALIAKGAKKPKNKFAGILEAGNILNVVYYYKASRNVQTLSEASVDYSSLKFRMQLDRASVLYAVLELIAQLVHENEENAAVFEFAVNFVQWLGDEDEVYVSIFPYVQVKMAEVVGIGLQIQNKANPSGAFLNISNGNISAEAENELAYKLTENQKKFLELAVQSRSKGIFLVKLENEELKQLVHHLDVYFKYHIDGYQDRRSDAVFEQMLQ